VHYIDLCADYCIQPPIRPHSSRGRMVSGHPGDPLFLVALWNGGFVATTAHVAGRVVVDSAGEHVGFCPTGLYIFCHFPSPVVSRALGVALRVDTAPAHLATGSSALVSHSLSAGARSRSAGMDVIALHLHRSRIRGCRMHSSDRQLSATGECERAATGARAGHRVNSWVGRDPRATFVLVGAVLSIRARLFLHARKDSGGGSFPGAPPFVCICSREASGDGDSDAPETERPLRARAARLRPSRLL